MVFEGPVLDTLGDGPVGLRRRVGPRGGELLVESVCQVFCGGERLLPLFPLELDRLVSPLFARLVVQRFYRPPKFCCVGPVVESFFSVTVKYVLLFSERFLNFLLRYEN